MFDSLFLIIISIFVPIIVFTGFKIFKCTNYQKFLNVLSIVLLALEILRFFYSTTFYTDAETPKEDLKFGIITILSIFSLFATFNNSKIKDNLRSIFVLVSLSPIILGLFDPSIYINSLDINGVCKAMFMVQCGLTLTIALFYVLDNLKVNPLNIIWSVIFILIYVGINALTIWYWKMNTEFNLLWYMSYLTIIISIPLMFAINQLWHIFKAKKIIKKQSNNQKSE